MGTGVIVRWAPGKLAPVSEPPGATPADSLTCLLPVSPATFCPFSGLLETLLFTSGGGHSLGSLVPLFIPSGVTRPFPSLPSQDKHAEEVRKNKELKEEASR